MKVGCRQLREFSNAPVVPLDTYRTAHQDHPFGNLPVRGLGPERARREGHGEANPNHQICRTSERRYRNNMHMLLL